jgi:hypothetical protein
MSQSDTGGSYVGDQIFATGLYRFISFSHLDYVPLAESAEDEC